MSIHDQENEDERGIDRRTAGADADEPAAVEPNESVHEVDDERIDPEDDGAPPESAAAASEEGDRVDLAAQVELLREENRRLRSEYVRARQSRYRRTALGLAVVGLLAGGAAMLVGGGRDVLIALAGTGLFGAVLTYYLTPGRFVAAEVGEHVYAAAAANHSAFVDELGLRSDRIYLPRRGGAANLYVPQRSTYDLPIGHAGPIVTATGSRGLLFEPTGGGLFYEFDRALTGDLADTPGALATQLVDALVEQFELAASARPDVDPEDGRVTVAVTESAFGAVDRFDHPIASFVAVGLAIGLERPIELEVAPGGERADWLVTCRVLEFDGEKPIDGADEEN